MSRKKGSSCGQWYQKGLKCVGVATQIGLLYSWWLNSRGGLVRLMHWSNCPSIWSISEAAQTHCSCFTPTSSPFQCYPPKWPFGERRSSASSVQVAEHWMLCLYFISRRGKAQRFPSHVFFYRCTQLHSTRSEHVDAVIWCLICNAKTALLATLSLSWPAVS